MARLAIWYIHLQRPLKQSTTKGVPSCRRNLSYSTGGSNSKIKVLAWLVISEDYEWKVCFTPFSLACRWPFLCSHCAFPVYVPMSKLLSLARTLSYWVRELPITPVWPLLHWQQSHFQRHHTPKVFSIRTSTYEFWEKHNSAYKTWLQWYKV